MRLEVLELIAAVAKSGSISAAARDGHIQQTTLSAAIKSVESELDIKIFERQYNGVALTAHGRELMKRALPMLDLYHEMQHINSPEDRMLVLHINRLLYSYFCYDILPQLHMKFPDTSMTVSMAPENPLENAMSGQFHIGIGCCTMGELADRKLQAKENGLLLIELLASEFVVYVSKDSPLCAQREHSDRMSLRGQSVTLGNSICKDLFFRAELEEIVDSYSIMDPFDPLQMLHSVSHNNTVAFAVGKRLIPSRFHAELDELVCLPIVEPKSSSYRYMQHYLICRDYRQRQESERALVDLIISMLQ